MKRLLGVALAVIGMAGAAAAADQSFYQAVPAEPVASKNLESPIASELDSIVNKASPVKLAAEKKPDARAEPKPPSPQPSPPLTVAAPPPPMAAPPAVAALPMPVPVRAPAPALREGINEIPPSGGEWNNFFHIVFSGLVALFAGGLCYVSWLQSKMLARSAQAAETAGLAARKSAEIAEGTLKHIERPYAFVSHVELSAPMAQLDIPVPHLHFGLANYGRTPAIMKALSAELEMTDMAGAITRFGMTRHDLPVIAAGAGIEGIRFTYDGLTEEKRYKITNGEIRLRLRVSLSYADFFYSPPYLEELRYIYDPLTRGFIREIEPVK